MSKCINCKHLGEDKKCFRTGEIETTNIEYDEPCNYFEPVEEVCIWRDDSISCELPCQVNEEWMLEMREYDFKYCPYCGKTISIRG